MDENKKKELIEAAIRARELSYAPYSGYAVGAALLTAQGKLYQGCNIENATYGATNCAERTAIFKAVSEGERDFAAIAIVGGKMGEGPDSYAYPCGICRQVMGEFCAPDFVVLVAKDAGDYKEFTLSELLPHCFELEA